ncbi:hypothetical protein NDU88_009570 [Pleurodeles waltl]|uniref:Uncharacterized protein n=1 Tax=Pleurodeles waltl TaxID=8319 RepID=A0AAV7PVA3_PLEWA|nr:hypothetical protein NDU88_009570 [Pleurodeles waltl]
MACWPINKKVPAGRAPRGHGGLKPQPPAPVAAEPQVRPAGQQDPCLVPVKTGVGGRPLERERWPPPVDCGLWLDRLPDIVAGDISMTRVAPAWVQDPFRGCNLRLNMMPAVVPGRVAVNCVAAACEAVAWQDDTWGTGCFLFLPDRVAADAAACGTSFGLGIQAVIDPGESFVCIRASGWFEDFSLLMCVSTVGHLCRGSWSRSSITLISKACGLD